MQAGQRSGGKTATVERRADSRIRVPGQKETPMKLSKRYMSPAVMPIRA
jgi:hypothetical protein